MFGPTPDRPPRASTWKLALMGFAAVALAPAATLILGMLTLLLIPAAVMGIPFMLPAFFGGAAEARRFERVSMRPVPRRASATATAS